MDREQLGFYAEKYGKAVFRAAYSYTRNFADSEDIIQETFLKLYKTNKSFVSDENVKAWLLRVAINISKDYLKSSWVNKRAELDEAMSYENEGEKALSEAMGKLKPECRITVFLYYYMGYSVKEISKIMSVSESNVKIRLKRSRDSLREFLTEE